MEPHPLPCSSSVAYPRWVMLSCSAATTDGDDDAKTVATARTRNCHPIQVSLRLAEPPALSRVLVRVPDGLDDVKSQVLAAHGDSVLIKVHIIEKNHRYGRFEHIVYNAGDHATEPPRPPSLWLLPSSNEKTRLIFQDLVTRGLSDAHTGLLRRGQDELVVAELRILEGTPSWEGELFMFRSGQWKYHRFEIGEGWDRIHEKWETVVAVDDRLLCWVDMRVGVMLVDVFKETPTVQYVRLPMDPRGSNGNVCAIAGGGTLKFVNIVARCCCCGAAATCSCQHSRRAYTIHTWTLRMIGNGDMEWVKDGMVDATELWALDAYKGLPCDPLDLPVVSIDEPEVICFRLGGAKFGTQRRRSLWHIMVNIRSKTIHSVSRHEEDPVYCNMRGKLIPSKVSYFFNAYPSRRGAVSSKKRRRDAILTGQSQIEIQRSPSVVVYRPPTGDGDASNRAVQASEIFEALQEIPSYGLGPDEVIKAYRILCNNNGRRLRSLLRLPKILRKSWLRMEIRTTLD